MRTPSSGSILLVALVLSGVALVSPAPAAPVVSEGFQDYNLDSTGSPTTDSALTGNTGGSGFSAAWTADADLAIVSPATPLSYTVTNASSQTVGTINGGNRAAQFNPATSTGGTITASRSFSSTVNADEAFARFLFRLEAGAANDVDFLTLYFGNSTSNPNFAFFGSANGDFTARNGSSGLQTGGPNIQSADVGSTTYLLVARLSKDTPGAASPYSRLDVWINPVLDSGNVLTSPTLSGTFTGGVASFNSLAIRNANVDADDIYLMDEIAFGTAAGDVVPGATGVSVPEPAAASLLLAALMLAARRRRMPARRFDGRV